VQPEYRGRLAACLYGIGVSANHQGDLADASCSGCTCDMGNQRKIADGCNTLDLDDFIRVASPAASTTARHVRAIEVILFTIRTPAFAGCYSTQIVYV
jgi:hypothetical protein